MEENIFCFVIRYHAKIKERQIFGVIGIESKEPFFDKNELIFDLCQKHGHLEEINILSFDVLNEEEFNLYGNRFKKQK